MTSDTRLGFGEMLRRCRVDAGLTQEELAEQAGISARAVSDLERGVNTRPRYDTVRRLGQALDLSAENTAQFERLAHGKAQPTAASRDETSLPRGNFLGALPAGTMVARDAEMRWLMQATERVRQGEGRLALVVGEPGIGKTRLAQELSLALRDGGFLLAAGLVRSEDGELYRFDHTLTQGTLYAELSPRRRRRLQL